MKGEADLVPILNRLMSVQYDGDPTIVGIEAAVPNLARMDWINCIFTASWAEIASSLPTDELERLTKILVIAEREYAWLGGSVAAPIWLFRAYCERADADADALAEWALLNRGRNDYIPFGISTRARTLEEWHVQQRLYHERKALHRYSEQAARAAKVRRATEAAERSLQRKKASCARHEQLLARVKKLRGLSPCERLSYIAANVDLPLEFIPQDLITECMSVAASVDGETKQLLVERIDRRQRKLWKDLFGALTE